MHLETQTAVKIMPLFSIRLLSHFNLFIAVVIYILKLQRRHLYPIELQRRHLYHRTTA